MTEGRLIRRLLRFERNFTQIPNDWLRGGKKLDNGKRELSLQARGLLGMLLSHDHNFSVSIKGLAADGHGGVSLIRAAAAELQQAGYLIRRPGKPGHGDDWELADPSGLSDPALFGYDGIRETGAKIAPPVERVRKSHPYGSEKQTPNKNTKEHLSRVNPGDPSTRAGDEAERFAPTVEPPSQLTRCPARAHTPCAVNPRTHVCIDCGSAAVPWVQPEFTPAEDSQGVAA